MNPGVWAAALAATIGASAVTARAQSADGLDPPVALPDPPDVELAVGPDLRLDAARLDEVFRVRAEREESGRILGGALQTVAGGANLGIGLWLMLDEGLFGGIEMRAILGSVGVGLGLTSMITGIYQMLVPGFAHERYRRWRSALAGGLTARELGRFEGELRAEAEVARFLRTVEAVSGFANAAAGLGVILATALAPLDTLGQIQGYSMGGGLALLGLIGAFGALLGESQAETDWRLYRAGEMPAPDRGGLDLHVTPTAGADAVGVSVGGSF